MACHRCPEGKQRDECVNPRHHCTVCEGCGIVRGHPGRAALDSFIACPNCQPIPAAKLRIVK